MAARVLVAVVVGVDVVVVVVAVALERIERDTLCLPTSPDRFGAKIAQTRRERERVHLKFSSARCLCSGSNLAEKKSR